MKITYYESDHGFQIDMEPETPKEVAELFRFTNNVKAEKPEVNLSFNGDKPMCGLWMRKVSSAKQTTSISNSTP